jgi:hypothetical protein
MRNLKAKLSIAENFQQAIEHLSSVDRSEMDEDCSNYTSERERLAAIETEDAELDKLWRDIASSAKRILFPVPEGGMTYEFADGSQLNDITYAATPATRPFPLP